MTGQWLNGDPTSRINMQDRGLSYGDGVFETIAVINHRPIWLDRHIERLINSAEHLKIPTNGLENSLLKDLEGVSYPETSVLKIIVTRGCGGRGYLSDKTQLPSRIIQLSTMPNYQDFQRQGIRLCGIEGFKLSTNPFLAGHKHLNRIEQVMARMEVDPELADEGITTDLEGNMIEGTMSNLFWVEGGVLFTPNLDKNGVNGIVRQWVLEKACEESIEIHSGHYPLKRLNDADEIFVTNSLMGIVAAKSLNGQNRPIGPLSRQLQKEYFKEIGL